MTRRSPWCVIPVKSRRAAKRRLATLLAPEERAGLVEAMLDDVLRAVSAARGFCGVMLVTGDARFAHLGRERGFRVLGDQLDDGTTAAVSRAATVLAGEGAQSLVVLHADLPLATPQAIETLLPVDDDGPTVTLVPDRERRGTNALFVRPVDLIPFRFGHDSLRLHQLEAEARGARLRLLDVPELAHDIDRPRDLLAMSLRRSGATVTYLGRIGIAARLDRMAPNAEVTP